MNFNLPKTNSAKRLYANNYKYNGEPVILSEYGGIGFEISKYSDSDWGYGNIAKTKDEFYNRFIFRHFILHHNL